ncbi:MAG: amidohydrolase family protein, partial [Alphaproteobacteria bacterium]|nr:amidohydrolase family protein [Alphaproteobacteria bacterium]
SATGFMYDLGDAYRANRGAEAMRWMWPHRSLIDAGIPAPGHSDAMVCDPNPFVALWSMVNRKAQTGASLDDAEAVTAEEALRAYTILGAWSGREEALKGSLEIGKLADIAILDRDYFSIPSEEIRDVGVVTTLLGGKIIHSVQEPS